MSGVLSLWRRWQMLRKCALRAVAVDLALAGCTTMDEVPRFASNASAALPQGSPTLRY
jgi:hypothetical protein